MTIRAGAAVRSKATGKLGRTFKQHAGKVRGTLWVQWDGERDRQTVDERDVTLVATNYWSAKAYIDEKEPDCA
jgi:hypothetical protein